MFTLALGDAAIQPSKPKLGLRVLGLVLAGCVSQGGSAMAQSAADPMTRANQLAYQAAMKCFVANGHAIGLRKRAGETDKAALSETKAHLSFDTALKLGQVLGLAGEKINEDLGLTQAEELPRMVADQRYFESAVSDCKALGLM